MRPLWKIVWNFLRKLKMELPFDPAIPLLELYPKNPETPIQKNLCIPMFIAAQFTIAKCWKQLRCPSVNEWIKKHGHLHNGIQSFLIHLFNNGHLGCFQLLAIVNCAAMNIGMHRFFWMVFQDSWGIIPAVGLLGQKADPFLLF